LNNLRVNKRLHNLNFLGELSHLLSETYSTGAVQKYPNIILRLETVVISFRTFFAILNQEFIGSFHNKAPNHSPILVTEFTPYYNMGRSM